MSQAGLWTLVPYQGRFFSSYTPGDFGTLSISNEIVSRVIGISTNFFEN